MSIPSKRDDEVRKLLTGNLVLLAENQNLNKEHKYALEYIAKLEVALNKIKSYENDLMKTKLSSCLVHIAEQSLASKPASLKG